ncbi:AAA family ATPase [Maioricimonas sp. JC845]|uniref:ATP-binding protein n=1 Tax=Maioricimonas sp. JC845 TaxID=3232138 RepID=UPI003457DEEA
MPMKKHTADLVDALRGMKRGGLFKPYIDFVQFPRYRNFQKDLRVSFDFPVTVIVGPNGTGKSSLLQALDGAPEGRSPGNWWFGTPLDPIQEPSSPSRQGRKSLKSTEKAAFWYGYHDEQGRQCQVVKMRIARRGDPDYWEPSRPIQRFGMDMRRDKDGKLLRDPVLSMKSRYLNFKTQINAFDRCFYFASPPLIRTYSRTKSWQRHRKRSKSRAPRIQDYLRSRSGPLRKALIDGRTVVYGRNRMHEERVVLGGAELEAVSGIIGRKYRAGTIIEHRFYETWGFSVYFETEGLSYSEAFAGSGESAVFRLVREVMTIDEGSLLLLDEPETSLHPQAQENLLRFLLQESLEKRLQVVISTHSPTLLRPMPREAICVLSLAPSGEVVAAQGVASDCAFHVLGHPIEQEIRLIVEDRLACTVVRAVLETFDEAVRSRFVVDFGPGGASAMVSNAAIYSQGDSQSLYFLFDGDKKTDLSDDPLGGVGINATAAELDAHIKEVCDQSVKFNQDSNMSEDEKVSQRKKFLEFVRDRFRFLPFKCPEDAIWDDARARKLLESQGGGENRLNAVLSRCDTKERFLALGEEMFPASAGVSASDLDVMHKMFVRGFIQDKGPAFRDLRNLLMGIEQGA